MNKITDDILSRLASVENAVDQLQRGATATTPQAPEATDEELWAIWHKLSAVPNHSLRAIYNLGREHGSPVTPAPVPISAPEPTPQAPDPLVATLSDAVSALRYIEQQHGRLSGVGWDRVFNAAALLLGEPKPAPEPAPDFPPADCAVRLKSQGMCFSPCLACGPGSPNRESCRRALAQELPAPDSPPANCAQRLIRERRMVRPLRGKPYAGCAACGDDSPRWEACRRALAQELPAPTGSLLDQVAAAIAKAHNNRFPDEQYRSDAQWAVRAVARWLSDERWDVDVYHAAAVLREAMEHG